MNSDQTLEMRGKIVVTERSSIASDISVKIKGHEAIYEVTSGKDYI